VVCQRRQQKTAVTIRLETHPLYQNERSLLAVSHWMTHF